MKRKEWGRRFPRAARAVRWIDDTPERLHGWFGRARAAYREHGWRGVVTPRRIVLAGGSSMLAAFVAFYWVTLPPALPDYAAVRGHWQPSEAWLYDRDGRLLDSTRVDYQARRLGWVKREDVSPIAREVLVAAEDRRFRSHGGIDWLATAGSLRARLSGQRARGASTLSMQVAAYLAPELSAPGNRGLIDKLRQMRAGSALDGSWSKDQILEGI